MKVHADDRVVRLASLWDGTWHLWMPDGNGALIKIQAGECQEGAYFAKEPARDTDICLPFLDMMWKRASWPEVTRWLHSIEDSIFKIAAAVSKIDHFSRRENVEREMLSLYITTDVEYIFGRCRSIFDDLQQVIAALWDRVTLFDGRRREELPRDSFRKPLKRIRRREPGPSPYGLPDGVIAVYERVSEFFFSMRSMRDRLTHRGLDLGHVFTTERGPAVLKETELALMVSERRGDDAYNENLVALRPTLAHLVCTTLYTLNEFAGALAGAIVFPESMVPEHELFLRTPHMGSLVDLQRIVRGGTPWRDGASTHASADASVSKTP